MKKKSAKNIFFAEFNSRFADARRKKSAVLVLRRDVCDVWDMWGAHVEHVKHVKHVGEKMHLRNAFTNQLFSRLFEVPKIPKKFPFERLKSYRFFSPW